MCPVCLLTSAAGIVSGLASMGLGTFAIGKTKPLSPAKKAASRVKKIGSADRMNTRQIHTQEKAS